MLKPQIIVLMIKRKYILAKKVVEKNKDPSKIFEIADLVHYPEFGEQQILERNTAILNKFFDFLEREALIA